jgi:hypothetical protein
MQYIYIIRNAVDGKVKVGVSESPAKRLQELQTANHCQLILEGVMNGNQETEKMIHRRLQRTGNGGGEWFEDGPEVQGLLRECVPGAEWMLFERSRFEYRLVDPETAQRWLSDFHFEGNRILWKRHVEWLADEMAKGAFKPVEPIAFACYQGEKWLINGQHRLWAIIASSRPQPEFVLEIELPNRDAVAAYYGACDIQRTRKFADMIKVYDLLDATKLSTDQVRQVGASVAFIRTGFRHYAGRTATRPNFAEQSNDTIAYGTAAKEYYGAIADAYPGSMAKALRRAAAVSVGLVLFKWVSQEDGRLKVEEFWRAVATGEMMSKGDPRWILRNHISETRMPSASSNVKRKTEGAGDQARVIAACWNAWYRGHTLHKVPVVTTQKPICIDGTPLDGQEGHWTIASA